MTPKYLKPKYLIFILLFVAAALFAIAWDLNRLNTDFNNLFTLLRAARADAFYKDTTIIVRFNGKTVTVIDQKTSTTTTATIPSITAVNYDTTLGKDMIVFKWRGTEQYNKRVHGGEIMLRSLLGFGRYIHVNCTGLVKEGRYPENG
jgi:Tfp pilus assembly protein FimT